MKQPVVYPPGISNQQRMRIANVAGDFTPENLEVWANVVFKPGTDLLLSLLNYANAWKKDRAIITAAHGAAGAYKEILK